MYIVDIGQYIVISILYYIIEVCGLELRVLLVTVVMMSCDDIGLLTVRFWVRNIHTVSNNFQLILNQGLSSRTFSVLGVIRLLDRLPLVWTEVHTSWSSGGNATRDVDKWQDAVNCVSPWLSYHVDCDRISVHCSSEQSRLPVSKFIRSPNMSPLALSLAALANTVMISKSWDYMLSFNA